MLRIADRVKETTTTTGTGDITLAGAATGFRTFAAVCSDQDIAWYGLQAVDGNGRPTGAWEIGVGRYNASGNTLTRSMIFSSSNAGAPVNLAAGTKQIWIGYPASKILSHPRDGEFDTPPILSQFSWVAQGGAQAVQRDSYISMISSDTSSQNLLMFPIPAPDSAWTAAARMQGLQALTYHGFGMVIQDSVSQNCITFGPLGAPVRVSSWSDPQSYVNSIVTGASNIQAPWLRWRFDGTKLYCDLSADGYFWVNAWNGTPASQMARRPDKVGFYLHNEGVNAQASIHSFNFTPSFLP